MSVSLLQQTTNSSTSCHCSCLHQHRHNHSKHLPRFATAPPVAAACVSSESSDEDTALDSEDVVYVALPLRRAAFRQYYQPQRHHHKQRLHLEQISFGAASLGYPLIAAAYAGVAVALLAAPQHAVQMFGAAASDASSTTCLVTFTGLLGGCYILQAAVALVVKVR